MSDTPTPAIRPVNGAPPDDDTVARLDTRRLDTDRRLRELTEEQMRLSDRAEQVRAEREAAAAEAMRADVEYREALDRKRMDALEHLNVQVEGRRREMERMRTQAAVDREQAAAERHAAQEDRRAAQRDREQAEQAREAAMRDRRAVEQLQAGQRAAAATTPTEE